MRNIVILGFALAASAAAAETPAAPAPAEDPNERICIMRPEIGSRLGRTRVCATRAQWAADRRAAQATTEHGQVNQSNPSGMSPGVRADAFGRYVPAAARGGSPN